MRQSQIIEEQERGRYTCVTCCADVSWQPHISKQSIHERRSTKDPTASYLLRQRLFADDCVLYREIKNENDSQELQKDLNSLMKWE